MSANEKRSAPVNVLEGRGILIARPRELAERLAVAVRAAGAAPFIFPSIEILPPSDTAALDSVIARLGKFDLAIFVSQNAVTHGMARIAGAWPVRLRAAAVGAATAAALRGAGVAAVIEPGAGADSEALAALPEFTDLGGRSVVIFRGEGGREWLRRKLEAKGARVEYAQCYRRRMPSADAAELNARWQRGGIEAVVVSSSEGLSNLAQMLGAPGRDCLRITPVFVPHAHVARAAAEAGIGTAIITAPGDEGTIAGLRGYFGKV